MTGLTPNNSQTIPTHMAIDPEVMEKARREHLGNDPASLTSSEQELTGNLVKAFGEMGDGLDFEKLTCVSGTNAEKAAQIVVWNSQLTGVKQAIKERADLLRLREQITGDLSDEEADLLQAAREDANDALHGRPNSNRRIRVAQSIRQGLQKSGHSPNLRKALDKAGSRGSLSFDLDIDPRDYLQATVSTSDGWAPEVLREDGYLSAITRPPRIADTIPQMTTTEAGIKYMVLRDRWGTIATGAADAAHGVSITTGGAVTFGASAGVSVANGDLIEGRWLVIANKQYTIKKAVGSTVTVTPNPAAAISNAAWELRDDSAALERGEGDEANEATLKWVEVSDDIQEIAVWIPRDGHSDGGCSAHRAIHPGRTEYDAAAARRCAVDLRVGRQRNHVRHDPHAQQRCSHVAHVVEVRQRPERPDGRSAQGPGRRDLRDQRNVHAEPLLPGALHLDGSGAQGYVGERLLSWLAGRVFPPGALGSAHRSNHAPAIRQ